MRRLAAFMFKMKMMKYTEKLNTVIPLLTLWYREHRRSLPWRDDPTPYHVWLSEIMLQQTRIEAVIPYYHRFLDAVPDIRALAQIEDDELMKLWEGLGYYSRARNLKKAAIRLTEKYGAALPGTAAELRTLPGIGDYTAGAVASIAFGEPEPAVDGNVLRVLTRVLAYAEDITLPATKKTIIQELRAVYPRGKTAGELTQALMELGEAVCIPNGAPKCDRCPLRPHCLAQKEGLTATLPVKSPKKARRQERKTVLLLSCRERFAIRKRPKTGLLSSLWELPNFDGHLSQEQVASALCEMGIEPISVRPCGDAVHVFTHVEWHMTGYAIECAVPSPHFIWESTDEILARYAIPKAFSAYTALLPKKTDFFQNID